MKGEQSEFLDTLTGEIGPLCITASTNKDGKIDFSKIGNHKNIFSINNAKKLLLPSSQESIGKQAPKTKKLIPNTKRDDFNI